MFAIPNKVIIGDESSPLLVFENNTIESIFEETATSLIGDELFVDQFIPVIKYGLIVRYIFVPKDIYTYSGFVTSDGYTLTSRYTYDIRRIPYGTPVRFYSNNRIAGLFYCDNVKRLGKDRFQINCVSAVGLMGKQRHTGNVYSGIRFDTLIREIIGDSFAYEIESDVAELQVYGWLPYGTKRSNLHQLLVAYGVTLSKSDLGGLLFTFLKPVEFTEIPSSRVYEGGSVTYGDPASRVEIIEHAYHYLPSIEDEVLYDTQGETAENILVTFDHPVYADSLHVQEDSALTISSYGTNYAVVSGSGVLLGKPYVHTTKRLVADNKEAFTEKIVSVEEVTLITMANSENCLKRISEYYFNATVVKNSIKVEAEKTGRQYVFENAFREPTYAFMSKMSTQTSSFLKADCEYITDYTPVAQGSSFLRREILELTEEGAIWNIPDSVYEKDVPQIRVALIGAGYDGENGTNGEDGGEGDDTGPGEGGAGGKGGKNGAGGKILTTTIDVSNLAFIRFGKSGRNTWVSAGDSYYTSANGISSSSGFVEMFTGAVYALPGVPGLDGAPGGNGGAYPPIAAVGTKNAKAEAGQDLEFEGVTYKGGKASSRVIHKGEESSWLDANMNLYFGGSGGGGAAAGANGGNATAAKFTSGGGTIWEKAGNGADALAALPTVPMYGCGGNGGSGGGGGGGTGNVHWWNHAYTTLISVDNGDNKVGKGGKASAGTAGYRGCLIIYY